MFDLREELLATYQSREKGKEKTDYLSPSRAIKCPRGAFMESLGYPEPVGPSLEAIFDYGTARHDSIQDRLLKSGVLLRNPDPDPGKNPVEWKFSMDDPPIWGYADGILSDNSAIVELKTTGKSLDSLEEPLAPHVEQATFYMHMSGIHKTLFLYESKGKVLDWKQFEVDYDPEMAEGLLNRCRRLLDMIARRSIPAPRPGCAKYCKNPACFSSEIHKRIGTLKK